MMTLVLALILGGAVSAPAFAQVPVPAPAPTPPSLPHISSHLDEEIREEIARALQSEAMAEQVASALRMAEKQMAELARQFPVPPVPPVPPRDAREAEREKQRERQPRRRVPEGWVESTEPFSRTFKVTKGAALMVSNVAGNIQVSPGSGDQIEVQAMKHAWGPTAEQAKQRLADGGIEAYATGSRVEIRVDHGVRNDRRGIDVEFDVKVPADTAVELRTVSGDIRVTNVKGEVRVQGVSGNLALEGTPRLAAVKTISGNISVTNAGADAQLSVSTINGNLVLQTLSARSLDLNTINGDVRIAGWSGERAHIRSLGGDLDLQTSLTKGSRYEIESHSGDILLSLPDQPGFELEANTFGGRIRIDFPIKSEGPIRDSDRGPRSLRGTYGDGSSSLRVQTFSGDLTVTRR